MRRDTGDVLTVTTPVRRNGSIQSIKGIVEHLNKADLDPNVGTSRAVSVHLEYRAAVREYMPGGAHSHS